MLIYLSHHKIDFDKWDECLEDSVNGIIYGYSWYLNIVSPHWDAIVKISGDKYLAIMPIPKRKKFGLYNYLIQPIFTQQLGVFYNEPLSEAEWNVIADLLRQKFKFITGYSFNVENTYLLTQNLLGFSSSTYHTYHLDLSKTYQEIVSGYRQDRKWRLNKARPLDLKVSRTTDIDLMLKIFDRTTAPRIRGVIGEGYEYRLLRELYNIASSKNLAEIYQIQDSTDNVLAMAMLFFFKNKIIYIFNTSTEVGKKHGAIAALLDQLFRQWAGKDYIFDFESPEVPQIASFYRSFGSVKQPFVTISLNNLPTSVKWLKQIRMQFYQQFLNRRK